MADVKLVAIGAGALALTHRPRLKGIAALPALGVTHVVTLLAEREGARPIGEAVERAGLTWIWCPLENGDPPGAARSAALAPVLAELAARIAGGARVLVHCSAGIHRTGMIGYALLRRLGLDAAAARARLAELREITSEGVGDARLAWGDAMAPPVR